MTQDADMDRSYKKAVEVLKQRIRPQRSTVPIPKLQGVHEKPSIKGEASLTGVPSIHGMKGWLEELGHSSEAINNLNVIHVSGTKGKGSTCSFIDSLLRAHSIRTSFPSKTGLYTSPHLIHPEERIRINFHSLPRPLFAKYFFEIQDLLSLQPSYTNQKQTPRPRTLQLYALLAFHVFIREGVDVAIIETHHGGEYDSTNVFEKPIVTCVTTLGLDHVQQLGSSMESIAWHKSGIFKPGARAVCAPVDDVDAIAMLRARAEERGVTGLEFVNREPVVPEELEGCLRLDVMRINFDVARRAVNAFLAVKAKEKVSPESCLSREDIVTGVKQWSWPGRFQTEILGAEEWYLDGAHNEISVLKAAEWFIGCVDTSNQSQSTYQKPKILIFAQIGHVRDGVAVLSHLIKALQGHIDHVILTTYQKDSFSDIGYDESKNDIPTLHKSYISTIQNHNPKTQIYTTTTIQEAITLARMIGENQFLRYGAERKNSGSETRMNRYVGGVEKGGIQVLVTGSQHLVGGALEIIRPGFGLEEGVGGEVEG